MRIGKWFAAKIGYRYLGCIYNRKTGPLFDFIETKVPKQFLNRKISDLGCGDGSNTERIRKIFRAKSIIGYDLNEHLLKRAKRLKVKKVNLNNGLPKGEVAVFTLSLHHLKDKERALREAAYNFDLLFLCEPTNDWFHRFFDAGEPLSEEEWIKLFDKVLGDYRLYRYKNALIVFYAKKIAS